MIPIRPSNPSGVHQGAQSGLETQLGPIWRSWLWPTQTRLMLIQLSKVRHQNLNLCLCVAPQFVFVYLTRPMLIQQSKVRHQNSRVLMNCLCLSWKISCNQTAIHSLTSNFQGQPSLFQISFDPWMRIYWLSRIPHWKLLRSGQGLLTGRSLFMRLGHFFYTGGSCWWWQGCDMISSVNV